MRLGMRLHQDGIKVNAEVCHAIRSCLRSGIWGGFQFSEKYKLLQIVT
jgi:hypothetical protein